MRQLVLRSFQSPGDIVMLTAAVRDLHAAYPGQFLTDVRTSADEIWEQNPHITPLAENAPEVQTLEMHYPLVHHSNQRPYHFIHGYTQYLEQQLGLSLPVTSFHGDIHLTDEERTTPSICRERGISDGYWILVAGGKYDFTAKWWNPQGYQAVVDHFRGRIQFVQCGEAGHWHPRIDGAVDLVGKTDLREFISLMHHAAGVLCPVTLAMHLAAAVETIDGRKGARPCVVVAGGREPPHWEAYPTHQFISTVGTLSCCATGGCWRSRCQLVGDGDLKDRRNVCVQPVQVSEGLRIPRCMEMITPEDVIRRIELYSDNDPSERNGTSAHETRAPQRQTSAHLTQRRVGSGEKNGASNVLIRFRHGLGAAMQLTTVLRHLKHYHADWMVDVVAPVGKDSIFSGLCRNAFVSGEQRPESEYARVHDLEWDEPNTCYANSPSTAAERSLSDEFRLSPIGDLCTYSISPSQEAFERARKYLAGVCRANAGDGGRYPVVLIHYEGNTRQDEKNLSVDTARGICDEVVRAGATPVILDWDARTPLADGRRIYNPGADDPLWGGIGTGDAAVLAALAESSALVIGINSGPLHVAGATSTPTIGVWTRQHPLHHFGHAANVVHLVPKEHPSRLRGNRRHGLAYFERHYNHRVYDALDSALSDLISERLCGNRNASLIKRQGLWIRRNNAEQDLVVVRDVLEQDAYRSDEIGSPPQVVVDVGAHIGCFTKRIHDRHPAAQIVAVECCPDNLIALRRNVDAFATIVPAALTYERDVALLNAVYPDCGSTGGSMVVPRDRLQRQIADGKFATKPEPRGDRKYWGDLRPMKTITLEELLDEHGLSHIDILKLDCEGSEFSILGHTTSLERIGLIVGEYHNKERFEQLVNERFRDWDLRMLKDGNNGLFWLSRPGRSVPDAPAADLPAVPVSPASGTKPDATGRAARIPAMIATSAKIEKKTNVLIKFSHGLGDAIQLTSVLQHLRHYHPAWSLDVAALIGKHSAFYGLCDNVWVAGEQEADKAGYQKVFDLRWHECDTCYEDSPSSKAERCLREVFHLAPVGELCTYTIQIDEQSQKKANRYLDHVCSGTRLADGRYPAVLIHYEGNTSASHKNLPIDEVRQFCDEVIARQMVPIILDWDRRSPLPDGKRIHNPDSDSYLWGGTGTGDARVLAALIEASSLFVGVDSGPLHVAAATTTPTVGVWTRHHPLHYMGLAENVIHVVPANHGLLLRGDPDVGLPYFEENYRFEVYDEIRELPAKLKFHLPSSVSQVSEVAKDGSGIVARSERQKSVSAEEPTIGYDQAPIFVSGRPRSGTTWMQWFLSQHPDIHIHGQLPNLDWQPGWQWYQQLLESGRWAERANERVGYDVPHYAGSDERRCRRLFATMIRDFLTGFALSKPRWGIKSLTWCMSPGLLDQVESLWPEAVWVVCIRDPFLAIASEKNTFRPDVDVNAAARLWVDICEFAQMHDPNRTVVFQIDQLPDDEARVQATGRVLQTIGVSHTPETLKTAKELGVIHKVKEEALRSFKFSDEDRHQMLCEVEGLAEWMQRLGYTLG